ncbi:MAG: butyrate kinase [Desulfovibrio sp.]
MTKHILTINPGSTSTKAAVFAADEQDIEQVFELEVAHEKEELAAFDSVYAQLALRKQAIDAALQKRYPQYAESQNIDAVVGRGGLLAPLAGGVYTINEQMLTDLRLARFGEHPCNLGAFLAQQYSGELACPAYVVDPVVTDEMHPLARVTGLPHIERRSIFHALSQRGAARAVCDEIGIEYQDASLIVAHMGGGISIGAHAGGKVIDVINALDGEGPFSPERAGRLPLVSVLNRLKETQMSLDEIKQTVLTKSGLWAHLGTNDALEVEKRIEEGDGEASAVYEAMAYNIAKEICSLLPAMTLTTRSPRLDGIILTGGLAKSQMLTYSIQEKIEWMAKVYIIAGTEEMDVMAQGAIRALGNKTEILEYGQNMNCSPATN